MVSHREDVLDGSDRVLHLRPGDGTPEVADSPVVVRTSPLRTGRFDA